MELVKYLIERGARTDLEDMRGDLPIDLAIFNKHTKIAKFMIDRNNIDKLDKNGRTFLHKTAQSGDVKLAEFLVEKGK